MRGPSLFLLFELDYLSEHSHSHTGWILLIPQNLSCYLHFAFCLFVCLIQLKTIPHSSHHRTASGDHSYYWEAERGDLEAWIARGPNLKWGRGAGPRTPLYTMPSFPQVSLLESLHFCFAPFFDLTKWQIILNLLI